MKPGTNPTPPAKPWVITEVVDQGKGHHYRYHVVGWNHNSTPPTLISWAVPSLADSGYDLSGAVYR